MRECLALVAETSLSGSRVAPGLDRLIIKRGKRKMLVRDNGTELTSHAILTWADHSRVADVADAEAISKGATRKTMRFVPIKTGRATGCRDGA